jgi:formylglycine-generating enzyme required for sulfatase activity
MYCCPGLPQRTADRHALAVTPAYVTARSRPDRAVPIAPTETWAGTNRLVVRKDGASPRRPATLTACAVDPFAVTNDWFAEFVAETGHVTEAERHGSSFAL